MELAPDLKL